MSSRVFVPFDNNPASVSIKTSSYIIPEGKYAKVNTLSALFSMNGTQIYPSQSISFSVSDLYSTESTGATTNTQGFSVGNSAYIYSASLTRSGNSTSSTISASWGIGTESNYSYSIGNLSRTTNGTTSIAPNVNCSTITLWVSVSANNNTSNQSTTGSISLSVYYIPVGVLTEFWVPSGTVLNGNNYTVTEYNAIS